MNDLISYVDNVHTIASYTIIYNVAVMLFILNNNYYKFCTSMKIIEKKPQVQKWFKNHELSLRCTGHRGA